MPRTSNLQVGSFNQRKPFGKDSQVSYWEASICSGKFIAGEYRRPQECLPPQVNNSRGKTFSWKFEVHGHCSSISFLLLHYLKDAIPSFIFSENIRAIVNVFLCSLDCFSSPEPGCSISWIMVTQAELTNQQISH